MTFALKRFDQHKLNTMLYDGYCEHTTTGKLGETTETWARKNILGKGAFGEVWLEEESSGTLRAVKQISGRKNICMGERELLALTTLKAYPQYFVQFLGWFEGSDKIYLAMEYVECGDLASFIHEEDMTEIDSKLVATQLLEGLSIMHKHNIAHRDLKPQNILISKWMPLTVKIADFGISKQTGDGTVLHTAAGTPTYTAPEVMGYLSLETSEYTNAVDIWSLGCLIHAMMTKETPFPACGTPKLLDYIQARVPFPKAKLIEKGASLEAIKFINSLMIPHPEDRPTADQALKDVWLTYEKGEETLWTKMSNETTIVSDEPQPEGDKCTSNVVLSGQTASDTETIYYPIETTAPDTDITIPSEQATPEITEITPKEKIIASEVVEHWSKVTDESRLARVSSLSPLEQASEQETSLEIRPKPVRRTSTLDSAISPLSPVCSVGGTIHSCSTLYCATKHQNLAAVKTLLEGGQENVNTMQRDGSTTLLHMAAKSGNEELAKMLVENGADLTAKDANKNTALHIAVEKGKEEMVKIFLSSGADAFAESDPNTVTGRSMLHMAARKGHVAVVKILLERGLVMAKRNDWGSTALYMAACEGHVDVVRVLLDEDKHEITRTDNYGDTPLHGAAARGRLEVVKLLVSYGAPLRVKSLSGHTPLSYAVKYNNQDVMKFLSKQLGISTVRARLFRG